MDLNTLLQREGLDPTEVIVARHRPSEPALNRIFPWIAAERADLFRAYQCFHAANLEGALKRAKYFAAFIRHGSGKALYIGTYEIGMHKPHTYEDFWAVPENIELRERGMNGFLRQDGRSHILRFDMNPTNIYANWKGRLIIQWPGLERSWWRWADRNAIPVHAITEESVLAGEMPSWDKLRLDWSELQELPSSWQARLTEWRGIYLIHDRSTGRGYVGSAYGAENILGRWRQYGVSGHGGNKKLRDLDPKNFAFTILQRVSPDMLAEDVIGIEQSWKLRLHTQSEHGLNDN